MYIRGPSATLGTTPPRTGGVPNGSVTVLRPEILRQATSCRQSRGRMTSGLGVDGVLCGERINPRLRSFTAFEDDKAGRMTSTGRTTPPTGREIIYQVGVDC
jgi:hypothetical protein